jgi:iron complex outermembrane receptor protein
MNLSRLGLIPALLAAPLVTAAEADTIEQMIVSGTRSEQLSTAIPASIQVVTAEDIKLSGASNLVQVLNVQAGIQVNDTIGNQGRGATISMRGFGDNNANNVLVMIDGRKLNNPTLVSPNLSSVSLQDIDRIEIIQGSAGTLFGDQATGGVINIITKRPEQFNAYLETARGTDDYAVYHGSLSQGFDNGLAYRLSSEKKTADNYRDHNQNHYQNSFASVNLQRESFGLFAEYIRVDDELNTPGALSSSAIANDRKQTFTDNEFSNKDTDSYRLGGHLQLSGDWQLLAEAAHREEHTKGLIFGINFSDNTKITSFEPRLVGTFDTAQGDILLTAGVDWSEDNYQSTLTFTDIQQQSEDYYLQVVVPISEQLKITTGGRQSNFEVDNTISNSRFKDDLSVFQLGAAYQINDRSRLFVRYDEGFRWANVDENGFTAVDVDFLKPQQTSSFELGYETQIDQLFLTATLYDLDAEEEILYDPTATGPSSAFGFDGANVNVDDSNRQGLVLSSVWQASEALSIRANYSYTDAEITAGTFKGNTSPFVAEQTANLAISYQLGRQWTFYADAQYTGPRYAAADHSNNGAELGGYTLYNLNARWAMQQFYTQLRVNNITGKRYNGYSGGTAPFDYNYPAPEQVYQLTLGYNF